VSNTGAPGSISGARAFAFRGASRNRASPEPLNPHHNETRQTMFFMLSSMES